MKSSAPWLDPQGKLVWMPPEWEPHPTEKGWRRGEFVARVATEEHR